MINTKNKIRTLLYEYTPIFLLYTSILNEIDFNNLGLKYFSFNFSYILIFYYSLKRESSIGYVFIFIAGLFNDVVSGVPMGISSLAYLLLCASAAYLRNITLRPSLMKDWVFFLITILVLNFICLNSNLGSSTTKFFPEWPFLNFSRVYCLCKPGSTCFKKLLSDIDAPQL